MDSKNCRLETDLKAKCRCDSHLRQCAARARVSVPGRDRRFRRRALEGVRGRAKPRRAAENAAGERGPHQPRQPDLDIALRRHPDHRALHRQGNRRGRRGAERAPDQKGQGRLSVTNSNHLISELGHDCDSAGTSITNFGNDADVSLKDVWSECTAMRGQP